MKNVFNKQRILIKMMMIMRIMKMNKLLRSNMNKTLFIMIRMKNNKMKQIINKKHNCKTMMNKLNKEQMNKMNKGNKLQINNKICKYKKELNIHNKLMMKQKMLKYHNKNNNKKNLMK